MCVVHVKSKEWNLSRGGGLLVEDAIELHNRTRKAVAVLIHKLRNWSISKYLELRFGYGKRWTNPNTILCWIVSIEEQQNFDIICLKITDISCNSSVFVFNIVLVFLSCKLMEHIYPQMYEWQFTSGIPIDILSSQAKNPLCCYIVTNVKFYPIW